MSQSELLDVTEPVHLRTGEKIAPDSFQAELPVDSVVDDLHRSTADLAGTHVP